MKYNLLITAALWILGTSTVPAQSLIKGITVVAPPSPVGTSEIEELLAVNTEWIALVPYGFSRVNEPGIRYNLDRQWWGEKAEGIVECIKLAHAKGIKVMLKPQVYIHGHWVGDVTFDNEADWLAWEKGYSEFINFYGDYAKANNVEMFCVGTEYKKAAQARPDYWRQLIKDFKTDYNGLVIYSSNWDGFEKVPFWDELDYVGISGYFPLTDRKTPAAFHLKNAWRPIKKKLRRFSKKIKKKIIFTEFGYMSIDGCAGKAWLIEKDRPNRAINEKAQYNAYEALFSAHWDEAYWGGGFLWKWFPAGMGHEGYPEKDYTPQGKLSESVIKKWYGKEN